MCSGCFTLDVSRPLLGLEQRFFNEQLVGNGEIVQDFQTLHPLLTRNSSGCGDLHEIRWSHYAGIWHSGQRRGREYTSCLGEEVRDATQGLQVSTSCICAIRMYASQPILGLIACPAIHEDDGDQVGELINLTAASIDDVVLKMLFVTVQQNNLEVCIEYATKSVVHCCSNLSFYSRYSFEFASTVEIWALKWTKRDLIYYTSGIAIIRYVSRIHFLKLWLKSRRIIWEHTSIFASEDGDNIYWT